MQTIQDPKLLKEKVKALYTKHVRIHIGAQAVQEDIQREYNRQRDYLERTVETLKLKLSKDVDMHRRDHNKVVAMTLGRHGSMGSTHC